MTICNWCDGAARRGIDEAVRMRVLDWQQEARASEEVEHFDRHSRRKVALLYAVSFACFAAYQWSSGNGFVAAASLLTMGLFSIPYTRVFMHSQMHWGMGGTAVTQFLVRHFISLQFSVPQTGYEYGHRLHHRYDNDFNPKGLPRDLQSTYVFSRNGKPTPALLWLPFYLLFFQTLVCAYLVLRGGKWRDILGYLMELGAILGLHATLFGYTQDFYLSVYLPALLLAWTASGIVLYVMHEVDARQYGVHPTNNSHSRFFNGFGDNDGFHIEHTLFPGLHPLYLERLHRLLPTPPQQNLKNHYVIAFVKKALRRGVESAAPAAQRPEDL